MMRFLHTQRVCGIPAYTICEQDVRMSRVYRVDVLSGMCRVGECAAYTVGDVRASLLPVMEFDEVCRLSECLEYVGWMFYVACIG